MPKPSNPPKIIPSTNASNVDKYAGLTKKKFFEVKTEEFKKQNSKISQKDITAKAEGAWKDYSSKVDKDKKKAAKAEKDAT